MIISDSSVGELWRFYNEYNPSEEKGKQIRALIYKLVKEVTKANGDDLGYVLDRFGIDPASWKVEL